MSELEEKLGTILSDPNMMQQIMGMAKMLSGAPAEKPEKEPEAPTSGGFPSLDGNMLKALSGIAQQSGIDHQQDSLLKALQPYLSQNRIHKLERAMGAARMASAASAFLNAGGLRLLTQR